MHISHKLDLHSGRVKVDFQLIFKKNKCGMCMAKQMAEQAAKQSVGTMTKSVKGKQRQMAAT